MADDKTEQESPPKSGPEGWPVLSEEEREKRRALLPKARSLMSDEELDRWIEISNKQIREGKIPEVP